MKKYKIVLLVLAVFGFAAFLFLLQVDWGAVFTSVCDAFT